MPRQRLIPYDANAALKLFANRPDGLTPNYTDVSTVTNIPQGLILRNQLVLKPESSRDLMEYTKDEEG